MGVRLDRLTALRWVAAVLVFFTHVNLEVLRFDKVGRLTDPGVSGVDFFFVLSGFVLAWSHRPAGSVTAFYRRRIARIVPLYVLAWLAGLLVSTTLFGDGVGVQLPSLVFLQAWVPHFAVVFAGATVLWSLSCEAFFYLLFPVLIGPIMRARTPALLRLATALVVVAIAVPLVLRPHAVDGSDWGVADWLIYPFPPLRLCEFVLGAVAAVLVRRAVLPRVPLGAALLLAAAAYLVAAWAPQYARPVAVTVLPYAVLIVAAAQRDIDRAGRTGPPRWAVRLGEWSYAFFLFQVVIIRAVMRAVGGEPGPAVRIGLAVLLLAMCVVAAGVLCELVEKPLERRLRGDGTLPVSLTGTPSEQGPDRVSERRDEDRPSRRGRGLLSSVRHR